MSDVTEHTLMLQRNEQVVYVGAVDSYENHALDAVENALSESESKDKCEHRAENHHAEIYHIDSLQHYRLNQRWDAENHKHIENVWAEDIA